MKIKEFIPVIIMYCILLVFVVLLVTSTLPSRIDGVFRADDGTTVEYTDSGPHYYESPMSDGFTTIDPRPYSTPKVAFTIIAWVIGIQMTWMCLHRKSKSLKPTKTEA